MSEGFGSGDWPGLVRLQNSKRRGSFSDSKRYKEGKLFQSADAVSRRKSILLHDWWLVKADSDSGGKQLGIGGYTLKENLGIRCFSSAYISKRHDAVTLETVDGIKLMLCGYINRDRTLENGFSQKVCEDFLIGFPCYWEEFATLSVSEDSSASKGVPPSDAYKTPAKETGESKTSSEKSKVAEAEPSSKKKTHEDSSASKGVPPSDAYKTRAKETGESKTSNEKSKVAEAESSSKKRTREDSSASKGVPPSDAYKTPAKETSESKTSSEKSKVAEAESSSKKKTRAHKQRMDSNGPLTRSRARLLDAPRYFRLD